MDSMKGDISLFRLTKLTIFLILCFPKIAWANKPEPFKRVCFVRGYVDDVCEGNTTECAVSPRGAPIGCATREECGSAAGSKHLKCNEDKRICCCSASENPCNNYADIEFENDELCNHFPNASVCQEDAGTWHEKKCRKSDNSEQLCKPYHSVCMVDWQGRPFGCGNLTDCPGGAPSSDDTDHFYYFNPKCDYDAKKCCCIPLVDSFCNDWTESVELESHLKNFAEKMTKKGDTDGGNLAATKVSFHIFLILSSLSKLLA